MVVLVGVGHFGFVLFAKTSKPIWPAPATPDPIFRPFYAPASLRSACAPKARKIGITESLLHWPENDEYLLEKDGYHQENEKDL